MPVMSGYHSRGYLPHLKVEGASYFVTFRLADSLPREAIAALGERSSDLGRRARTQDRERDAGNRREAMARQAFEIDAILNGHAGAAWMRDRRVADVVAESLRFFDGDRYTLHAWCVMPNHVHSVLQPLGEHTLGSILHTWKSFSSHKANRILAREGRTFWQHESYDHWIRDRQDLAFCCDYTEGNPVKAGLCRRPEDWPWSSATGRRRLPDG